MKQHFFYPAPSYRLSPCSQTRTARDTSASPIITYKSQRIYKSQSKADPLTVNIHRIPQHLPGSLFYQAVKNCESYVQKENAQKKMVMLEKISAPPITASPRTSWHKAGKNPGPEDPTTAGFSGPSSRRSGPHSSAGIWPGLFQR